MQKPKYHILVCCSFRASGAPQGVCHKKGAVGLLPFLENELADRGIDALVSSTGCLKVCEKGPIMVIYPAGWWYGQLDETRLAAVLDVLEKNEPATSLLIE
jgi:(2Fe-2S) ferredoxin